MSTRLTLHAAGQMHIDSAAQAAAALKPLAGPAAKYLFAAGVVGVGFLAVPFMTTGAAYDVVQGLGREASLHDDLYQRALKLTHVWNSQAAENLIRCCRHMGGLRWRRRLGFDLITHRRICVSSRGDAVTRIRFDAF